MWSVFSGTPPSPLSSSRLLIYKGVQCDKICFFFSRSVGVRPSSRPPPSRPTSTSPRRSRHVILRRRSASRSTASRSGSRAPSRRNRYTSVVQFSTSLVNVLYIVILVSLLSEDISFRLFWKTRRFEVS